jgi:alpha-tubulin suppressor-like RCC1 family protein
MRLRRAALIAWGVAAAIGCAEPDIRLPDGGAADGGDLSDADLPACDMRPGEARILAAGAFHTCAIKGGEVLCWGANENGELGRPDPAVGAPAAVDGIMAPNALAAGGGRYASDPVERYYAHTCALTASSLLCWGANAAGQLGNGSLEPTHVPTPVLGALQWPIALGGFHGCAASPSREVHCWGDNRAGAVGRDPTTDCGDGEQCAVPAPAAGVDAPTVLGAGLSHTCAATADGAGVSCWGDNGDGQLARTSGGWEPRPFEDVLDDVVDLCGGERHTCALTCRGEVYCWGAGPFVGVEAAGDGPVTAPMRVEGIEDAYAIACGASHTCAVSGCRIACWGDNTYHQLGNGVGSGQAHSRIPVALRDDQCIDESNLTAGVRHTCVFSEMNAFCWGANDRGQLGSDSPDSSADPIEVPLP